jgi:hypothetical protein
MDFKKFGNVVLILGIVILLYGGLKWVSNQPREASPSFPGDFQLAPDNSEANANRSAAITILVAGGIVAFVGLGISYSSNKKE